MALNLQHQTSAQFAARLRGMYKGATREQAARIAVWIIARIAAGDLTDTQMCNAFGLTVTQWTTLKARMQTLRDQWTAIQAATGE